MKILEINSGLGNQICQYVFLRYLEISCDMEDVLIDESYYHGPKQHNGYELENLFKNAKLNYLKSKFQPDAWQNILNAVVQSGGLMKVPNIFQSSDVDMVLIADEYWYDDNGNFNVGYSFDGKYHMIHSKDFYNSYQGIKEKIKEYENIYFMGGWITDLFGNDIKNQIEHELQFLPLQHQENIDYKDNINSQELSVGLHVRKGDFIKVKKDISTEKYAKSIKDLKRDLVKNQKSTPSFYVFSDDINWCKDNKKNLGFRDNDYVVFIEGNDIEARNYIDMQLMTFCDYLIHNKKSSFCIAAALISPKKIERIEC